MLIKTRCLLILLASVAVATAIEDLPGAARDASCADTPDTPDDAMVAGFGHKLPSCAAGKPFCTDAQHGARMRELFPKLCSTCASHTATVSPDDGLDHFTSRSQLVAAWEAQAAGQVTLPGEEFLGHKLIMLAICQGGWVSPL